MIGKIFNMPSLPAGFTIKVKSIPDSVYKDINATVAGMKGGQVLYLTASDLKGAIGGEVPKCFRNSLGRHLRDAFGKAGCEIVTLENKATGEVAYQVTKALPPAAPEAK
jgi:hypothetical protein